MYTIDRVDLRMNEPASGPASRVSFRFVLRDHGENLYEVHGDGESYRITLRTQADAEERAIFAGSDVDWQRDVAGAVNLVHRRGSERLSPSVVAAFNAWRAAEHTKFLHWMAGCPDIDQTIPPDDPLRAPPPAVRSGYYVIGEGWRAEELPAPGYAIGAPTPPTNTPTIDAPVLAHRPVRGPRP